MRLILLCSDVWVGDERLDDVVAIVVRATDAGGSRVTVTTDTDTHVFESDQQCDVERDERGLALVLPGSGLRVYVKEDVTPEMEEET